MTSAVISSLRSTTRSVPRITAIFACVAAAATRDQERSRNDTSGGAIGLPGAAIAGNVRLGKADDARAFAAGFRDGPFGERDGFVACRWKAQIGQCDAE